MRRTPQRFERSSPGAPAAKWRRTYAPHRPDQKGTATNRGAGRDGNGYFLHTVSSQWLCGPPGVPVSFSSRRTQGLADPRIVCRRLRNRRPPLAVAGQAFHRSRPAARRPGSRPQGRAESIQQSGQASMEGRAAPWTRRFRPPVTAASRLPHPDNL